jgi:hypothetical protein
MEAVVEAAALDEADATDSLVALDVPPVWVSAGSGKNHFHCIMPPSIPICKTSRKGFAHLPIKQEAEIKKEQ